MYWSRRAAIECGALSLRDVNAIDLDYLIIWFRILADLAHNSEDVIQFIEIIMEMIMSTNRGFINASFIRKIFPETKWDELLSSELNQVFQRLREAGSLGAKVVDFLQTVESRKVVSIEL